MLLKKTIIKKFQRYILLTYKNTKELKIKNCFYQFTKYKYCIDLNYLIILTTTELKCRNMKLNILEEKKKKKKERRPLKNLIIRLLSIKLSSNAYISLSTIINVFATKRFNSR